MLLVLLVCTLVSTVSCTYTVTPSILDRYDILLQNGGLSKNSSIYYNRILEPIPVYDFDGHLVKEISEVDVECYSDLVCDKSLTTEERYLVSLYATFLELSGNLPIKTPYSLGVLRREDSNNVVGQFTKSFYNDGTVAHMSFWIRLQRTSNNKVDSWIYADMDSLQLTLSILELSVHERTHYDVTKINIQEGHGDLFQSRYNTLIREAIQNVHRYHSIVEEKPKDNVVLIVSIISGVIVVGVAILIAVSCK